MLPTVDLDALRNICCIAGISFFLWMMGGDTLLQIVTVKFLSFFRLYGVFTNYILKCLFPSFPHHQKNFPSTSDFWLQNLLIYVGKPRVNFFRITFMSQTKMSHTWFAFTMGFCRHCIQGERGQVTQTYSNGESQIVTYTTETSYCLTLPSIMWGQEGLNPYKCLSEIYFS